MQLVGSCQCAKVTFTVDSETPVPFMYCFCSICRKLEGGAFGCNIMGRRSTLVVRGRRHLRVYHPRIRRPRKRAQVSEGERWFCGACGTHLYVLDERWPEGVWPNVSAIDTPLPAAPEQVSMMVRYKPRWVPAAMLGNGPRYPEYPKLSIMAWHEQHGLREPAGEAGAKVRRRARKTVPA
jgi:hypothetical protein